MVYSENIAAGEKITARVRDNKNPITQKLVNIVSSIEYDLFVHKEESLSTSRPIFTLILTIYDANIRYIEESLDSVFKQTYQNTEVILINNGAKGAVETLIWNFFLNHKNAKLIHTKKNLYCPTAKFLLDPLPNLWNAGLFCSIGDFVYFMSYDDAISPNYTEEMVALFTQNEKCCTAAPLIVSVNEASEINITASTFFKNHNIRDKYTTGISLAESYMRGENKISFPGGLLAIKSNLVLDCGGFEGFNDLSQLFRFAICGESGFSSEATLYWRHHSGQTNRAQTKMGLIYYRTFKEYNKIYDLKKFHEEVVGSSFAKEYERYINQYVIEHTITAFQHAYKMSFSSGLKALVRVIIECPFYIQAIALRCYLRDFHDYFRQWAIARFIYHKFFKRKKSNANNAN